MQNNKNRRTINKFERKKTYSKSVSQKFCNNFSKINGQFLGNRNFSREIKSMIITVIPILFQKSNGYAGHSNYSALG